MVEDVQIALGKALDKVTIGDPRLKEVRMGSLISKQQVEAVKDSVQDIAKEGLSWVLGGFILYLFSLIGFHQINRLFYEISDHAFNISTNISNFSKF